MLADIVRRILQSVVVLLAVDLVAFPIVRFVGDPVEPLLGQERTVQDVERLHERLGSNDPFSVQYAAFLERAVQGDFGIGYQQSRPVATIIAERATAKLELALM